MVVRFPKGNWVEAEVVMAPADVQRGLQGRARATPMLFLFSDRVLRAMWMKDVRFPLDIIFIDGTRVVSFALYCAALTTALRPSLVPCDKVLEMPAGWVLDSGVTVGTHVTFA